MVNITPKQRAKMEKLANACARRKAKTAKVYDEILKIAEALSMARSRYYACVKNEDDSVLQIKNYARSIGLGNVNFCYPAVGTTNKGQQ